MLRVLVPVKRVVDYAVKVRVRPDKLGVDTNNVKMSMNPFDQIALEEAIRLKEKGLVKEIVTVSLGPKHVQETLRFGIALGFPHVDRSIHVETEGELEPLAVAQILKKLVEKESPNLVVLGKQAIDDDCHQTGQMLAGMLNWPQGTAISKIDIVESNASIVRETDTGLETLSVQLPAIVTCDLRLNEPRYAKLTNITKARQAVLQRLTPEELGVNVTQHVKVVEVNEPPKRAAGIKVQEPQDIVENLKKLKAF